MDAFVIADLTEEVGQRFERPVLGAELAVVRLVVQPSRFLHQQRVLVLGVIFKVSVEPVAPVRTNRLEQPRELVVAERQ